MIQPQTVEPSVKREKGRKDDSDDEIDVTSLNLAEGLQKISRRTVVEGIIKPRLNEICTEIGKEIKKSGYGGLTPAGIVLCGGGAETLGLIEAARRNLAMQARIGMPIGISGLIDEITTPSYATSVGIVLHGVKSAGQTKEKFTLDKVGKMVGRFPIQGIAGKITDLIKSFLP